MTIINNEKQQNRKIYDTVNIAWLLAHPIILRHVYVILPAKAWDYVFTGVGLCVYVCVCVSATTITKKIVDAQKLHYTAIHI